MVEPKQIALFITEDINTNNGLVFEDLQQQLIYLKKQLGNKEKILPELAELDPTEEKVILHKYVQWITNKTLRWPEDKEKLKQAIADYTQIKKKYLKFKNITKYNSLQELTTDIDKILRPQELKTAQRQSRIIAPNGSEKIYEDKTYTILKITTSEAAVELSKGTKWCTSNNRVAQKYLKEGPLYVIYKDGRKYAQLHINTGQIADIRDNSIIPEVELGDILMKFLPKTLATANMLERRIPEAEPYIIEDPDAAFKYALYIIKSRWPEAEPYIIEDPDAADSYALYVIKGRWPEAEPYIIEDPIAASNYAAFVIKGRWPEAEPYIIEDPIASGHYALYVIKGRWPEAEPYIMKDPNAAGLYASDVIKGRWPEAEPYIMKDPNAAGKYAAVVIKGRWPEAEPYIMKDPNAAGLYTDVIKGRWPEAEPYIFHDKQITGWYQRQPWWGAAVPGATLP
jgi:hypothetical protein